MTGLVDYLYRSYNPIDGRWTQRDPIAEYGGINLYGFVGNKPVNLFDLLGREPEPINKPFYTDVEDLRIDVEQIPGKKNSANCHIQTPEGGKYMYINGPDGVPDFRDKDGNQLPKEYRKMLANKQSKLARQLKNASRYVDAAGGLSPKYGGGKVLGAIGIIFTLELVAGLCEKYLEAFKEGDLGAMDTAYGDLIMNAPELPYSGTATRAAIAAGTEEYHDEMRRAALKNKKR